MPETTTDVDNIDALVDLAREVTAQPVAHRARLPYVSHPEIVQPWASLRLHKPLTIIETAPDMAGQPAGSGGGS